MYKEDEMDTKLRHRKNIVHVYTIVSVTSLFVILCKLSQNLQLMISA